MDTTIPSPSTIMDNLHHSMPGPEGWQAAWVDRKSRPLGYYEQAVLITMLVASIYIFLRYFCYAGFKLTKEWTRGQYDETTYDKKMEKVSRRITRTGFKLALANIAHTLVVTVVDGYIAIAVLAEDVSQNPEVWKKEMILSIALYCVYLFVLFVASFILVPFLQMVFVTWALTRLSRKHVLSDYVPHARHISTAMAVAWTSAAFFVVCEWPLVGKTDDTDYRFAALQAIWGSALAWLEASFLFNYLSHAIGEKELNRGNGVAEIVSLFAKAAASPFGKKDTDVLPMYEPVAQTEADVEDK